MVTWLIVERLTSGHSTLVGAVSGAVAGLATITPSAGYVSTGSALLIGLIAGCVCCFAVRLKHLLRYDDALDVIAVHFVGGLLGSFLVGFFADSSVNPVSADGLFAGGGGILLWHQVVAIVCVVVFSFVISWLAAALINRTLGLREPGPEQDSLDKAQQGQSAYSLSGITAHPTTSGRGAGAPPLAAQPGETWHVISAVVNTERLDGLRDALLMAGARSMELTETTVYTGRVRTEVFRSDVRKLDFEDRMRVYAAVDDEHEEAVAAVLRRFGAEPESFHRLEISP
jgi:nitrogen regulatory protein PII